MMRLSQFSLIALVVTIGTAPVLADTMAPQNIVEFSPAPETAGEWAYNGAGVLSFDQDIVVDTALGSNYDALTGAHVYLPTFQVGGIQVGTIKIRMIEIGPADMGAAEVCGFEIGFIEVGTLQVCLAEVCIF